MIGKVRVGFVLSLCLAFCLPLFGCATLAEPRTATATDAAVRLVYNGVEIGQPPSPMAYFMRLGTERLARRPFTDEKVSRDKSGRLVGVTYNRSAELALIDESPAAFCAQEASALGRWRYLSGPITKSADGEWCSYSFSATVDRWRYECRVDVWNLPGQAMRLHATMKATDTGKNGSSLTVQLK